MQIGGNLHVQPAFNRIFSFAEREKRIDDNCEMRIVAQRIPFLRFYSKRSTSLMYN